MAIAAAINIDRIVAWLEERPRATTRTSRFAALAPVHDLSSEPFTVNWLRVLGTTELAQIDQRVCQQLHAIMPLLYTFKS